MFMLKSVFKKKKVKKVQKKVPIGEEWSCVKSPNDRDLTKSLITEIATNAIPEEVVNISPEVSPEVPLGERVIPEIIEDYSNLPPPSQEEFVLVPTDIDIRIEKAIECLQELWSVDNKAQAKIFSLFLVYWIISTVIGSICWNNTFINGLVFWGWIIYISYSYETREKIFSVVDVGFKIYDYGRRMCYA